MDLFNFVYRKQWVKLCLYGVYSNSNQLSIQAHVLGK